MLIDRKLCKGYFSAFQIVLTVLGSLICLMWGAVYAFGFLLGSSLMFLANIIFLSRFFLFKAQYHPFKEVCILYVCEFIKLVMIAVGTVIIAIYIQPKILPYISGLFVLQLAMWCMPLFIKLTRLK